MSSVSRLFLLLFATPIAGDAKNVEPGAKKLSTLRFRDSQELENAGSRPGLADLILLLKGE